MSKRILALVLLSYFIVFVSCEKENDSGLDKSPGDPCSGIVCENDGVCMDGICQCLTGYAGLFCDSQITPSKMFLDSVILMSFPQTNNGQPWDSTGDPDLHIVLVKGFIMEYNFGVTADAKANMSYVLRTDPTYVIEDVKAQMFFAMEEFDFSNGNAQFMASIYFTPYSDSTDFPAVIALSDGKGFDIELYVRYSWD